MSPSSGQDDPEVDGRDARALRRAIVASKLARVFWRWRSRLLLRLSAVWAVPWFVTQDGPAHVYNAQILAESFDAGSPSRAGLHDLVEADPELDGPPCARRAGLATAGMDGRSDHDQRDASWSCRRHALAAVAGRRRKGPGPGGTLCRALLAMNLPWLLGFTSFLLGSCLFPITLGVWWEGRYRLSVGRIVGPLGVAVPRVLLPSGEPGADGGRPGRAGGGGPGAAASTTGPGSSGSRGLLRTSISFHSARVALVIFYLRTARRSGPLRPVWENLSSPWSPAAWGARLGWVDPITLAIKDGRAVHEPGWPRLHSSSHPWSGWWLGLVLWWYGRISAGRP